MQQAFQHKEPRTNTGNSESLVLPLEILVALDENVGPVACSLPLYKVNFWPTKAGTSGRMCNPNKTKSLVSVILPADVPTVGPKQQLLCELRVLLTEVWSFAGPSGAAVLSN